MMPNNTTAKIRNENTLTRSATAPETIVRAAATNTIWRNQSDAAA